MTLVGVPGYESQIKLALTRALGELWAFDPLAELAVLLALDVAPVVVALEVGDELVVLSFGDLVFPAAQSLDLHALPLVQHLVD